MATASSLSPHSGFLFSNWQNPRENYSRHVSTSIHRYNMTHKLHRNLGFTSSLGLFDLPISYPAPTGLILRQYLITAVHNNGWTYREHSQNLFPLLGPGFITTNVSHQQGLTINRKSIAATYQNPCTAYDELCTMVAAFWQKGWTIAEQLLRFFLLFLRLLLQ